VGETVPEGINIQPVNRSTNIISTTEIRRTQRHTDFFILYIPPCYSVSSVPPWLFYQIYIKFLILRYLIPAVAAGMHMYPVLPRQGLTVFVRSFTMMTSHDSIQILLDILDESPAMSAVRQWYKGEEKQLEIAGAAGSLYAVLIAFLFHDKPSHFLIVAEGTDNAAELYDDLTTLLSSDMVYRFEQPRHASDETLDAEEQIGQIETLDALSRRTDLVIVTTPAGLTVKLPPPENVRKDVFSISVGKDYDFDTFLALLRELGFERKPFVEGYGDYSVRGGIIDVFPFVGNYPVRLDFWGNRVESIREFDVLSQRSIKQLEEVHITPNLIDGEADKSHTLLDYLSPEALLMWADRDMLLGEFERNNTGNFSAELTTRAGSFRQINHLTLRGPATDRVVHLDAYAQPSFRGSIAFVHQDLVTKWRAGYRLYISADGTGEAERIREIIEEFESEKDLDRPRTVEELDETRTEHPPVTYIAETLQRGFVLHDVKTACYTEHEIFGRIKRRKTRNRKRFKGFSLHEIQALKRGDYVVHVDHGIGRFDGLQKMRVGGIEQEGARILYTANDILYVNLNYIHRIQKYSSKEGHVPVISRLGSGDWERVKARTKRKVKDIARELILLYAKRKSSKGFAFSEDTHWQKELEASFIYEDTPDQADATSAVKSDMEAAVPMDRLICGDVGFGKTEVAVRAAFKTVMDNKQVAVLVPTTILAEQHLQTFRDRMERFSVYIEVLSRFRTPARQRKIIEGLKKGPVDVVIGTHRLLSKDVEFKDLGLLVIDEEHRFGVTAKEKLRRMRVHVDTLTLTATPIPRTLNFSLMGARDLSIINTPPKNRLPIITEIAVYSKEIIREAIIQELNRGGQVYIIHDRVADIDMVAGNIRELVPESRVRVAHGQMKPQELEKTMVDFLEKKFNVLISTKIIESGIDIPSVNTIVITRADRFGLAELYQLRGRVGRSNVQAYAYLLTPALDTMSRQALRRLQAIEEFTELGSGFTLSMRDLEIRGAGNLLGAEQSGFIDEVGFEMYQKLVDDAVRELKEEEFGDLFPDIGGAAGTGRELTAVNAGVNAFLPDSYVEYDAERLEIYRRLYAMTGETQLDEITAELIDRFGAPPPEALALLRVIRLRIRATGLGFSKIDAGSKRIVYDFPDVGNTDYYDGKVFTYIISRVPLLKNVRARIHETDKKLKLIVHLDGIADTGNVLDLALDIIDQLTLKADQ
jgi:transcription-repair coupling factor (superfamily II helicase)